MEMLSRKRDRSPDSSISLQSKVHVSQHFLDSRDASKMRKVHAKTIAMLFKGAKNDAVQRSQDDNKDLRGLLILSGDGKLDLLYHKKPTELSLQRRPSKCCEREAFVNAPCINCNVNLCEFCGYSCVDCRSFVCSTCITLFGCGTIEYPKCTKCYFYE